MSLLIKNKLFWDKHYQESYEGYENHQHDERNVYDLHGYVRWQCGFPNQSYDDYGGEQDSGQGKKVKWTAYALYGSRGIVSNIVQRFLPPPRLFDIMCGRYSTYSRYNATADS